MARTVTIVGIGDDGPEGLPPATVRLVAEAEVLIGGSRHHAFFPGFPGERWFLQGSLDAVIGRAAQARERRLVVLASGDPLFFGVAERFVRELGRERVEILPHISSVQLAFSRLGESWQDAALESIHGRSLKGLAQRIDGRPKVAILTDREHSPAAVARYLLEFGLTEYEAFVAENLGSGQERTSWWSLEDLAAADFSPLSLVVLRWQEGRRAPFFPLGIDDHLFAQRRPDKGLLTKQEVRVLSLSALHLRPDSVVWDIGAGSGSVAVEAARLARQGRVFAVEKNEEDIGHIRENMRKFRADLHLIHAKAPRGLEEADDPDAVFVGGSGGALRELLAVCTRRLRPGGRIVVNAVTLETLFHARSALEEEGFATSVTLVQTARSKPILDLHRLEGLNPVFLIAASRSKEEMA